MPLRVVVLGNVPARVVEQLAQLCSRFDLLVHGCAPDRVAALDLLRQGAADIALAGAAFSDRTSVFPFLRALGAVPRPTAIVLVSERDEDAVQAFELQLTDFVLLPVAASRLEEAMTRARQQVLQVALLRTADDLKRLISEASSGGRDLRAVFPTATSASAAAERRGGAGRGGPGRTGTLIANAPGRAANGAGAPLGEHAVLDLSQEARRATEGPDGRPLRVLVREGRRTRFVPLTDVDWFEADGNYIVVHAGADRYRTRGTITAIENALDPRQYIRIHRRMVVNMDRVREMSPLPGGDGLLVLGDGSTLRLSRTYRARVR